jgi:hypothetical protein
LVVLTTSASTTLLAQYGWRRFRPTSRTRMTVEISPLQVTMSDDDTTPVQDTPPWVYVAVGPDLPVLVAVELAGNAVLPEDPPDGSQPVLAPDDPRNQFLAPSHGGPDNGLWCYWWSSCFLCR